MSLRRLGKVEYKTFDFYSYVLALAFWPANLSQSMLCHRRRRRPGAWAQMPWVYLCKTRWATSTSRHWLVTQFCPVIHALTMMQALVLNQEYTELDLFNHGLAQFSTQDFQDADIDGDEQFIIQWMGNQEIGHAQLFTNILALQNASQLCNYSYPSTIVQRIIDFSMRITRLDESGTLSFLEHLNSRASASLLLEAISTESYQEMVFRQLELEGLISSHLHAGTSSVYPV